MRTLKYGVWGMLLVVAWTASAVAETGPAKRASGPAGPQVVRPASARGLSQVYRDQQGDVTFSGGVALDGGFVLDIESPAVRVRRTNYHDRVNIELTATRGRDQVQIAATASTVQVTRSRRTLSLDGQRPDEASADRIQALLSGSRAVRAFKTLIARLEAQEDGALVDSVLVSGALVALLDGDAGAPARVARRLREKHVARAMKVSGQVTPSWCFYTYAASLFEIYYDWEKCMNALGWWNYPLHLACGVEWAFRAEAAWFWFIACNGGFPMK